MLAGAGALSTTGQALALAAGLPLAVLVGLVAVAGLAAGAGTASLPLPLGPPGLDGALALDPIGLLFTLLVAIAAGAGFAVAEIEEARRLAATFAAALLALLAGDAFLLATGLGLALLASGAVRAPAPVLLLLLAGLAAASPHAGLLQGDGLAALRAAGTATGAAPLATVLCGALASLLLIAFAGMPGRGDDEAAASRATAPARATIAALLGGFLLFRLPFDLAAVPPGWTGLLLLVAAVAGALAAAASALRAPTLPGAFADLARAAGLLGAGFAGLALLARAADLAPLAGSAAAAALLAFASLACARPLAGLAAHAVALQAGSVRLAALGGLRGTMPATALAALVASVSLAGLPPLAGFPPLWLGVHALLAAAHGGGPAVPILLAGVLAAIGLAVGIAAAAVFRAGAVAFLGRPRTPRGAAASEAPAPLRRAAVALAALLLLLALLPGPFLRLAAPVLRTAFGAEAATGAGLLAIRDASGGAALSQPLLALLLAGLAGAAVLAGRRLPVPAPREAATWDGGGAPPPEWLPFGEPQAQAGAPFLAAAVRAAPAPGPAEARRAAMVAEVAGRAARDPRLARVLGRLGTGAGADRLLLALLLLLLLAGAAGWLGA